MDDHDLIERIDNLVGEEHGLRERAEGQGLADNERERLENLEVALDQCWDLLPQRRALRHKGQDPDEAEGGGAGSVEGYRQWSSAEVADESSDFGVVRVADCDPERRRVSTL